MTTATTITMKRSREEDREVQTMAMANCLMLLSRIGQTVPDRVFECKTCNRQFPSFQALGGHRASHKKPRSASDDDLIRSPVKPKTHECSICGLEFAIGQALGGHMRRHRKEGSVEKKEIPTMVPVLKRSNSKRVLCLDLNLTPFENDVNFGDKMMMTRPLLTHFV